MNDRHHKTAKLQYTDRYTLTIPKWLVEKVMGASKGSVIGFDFKQGKLILEVVE